MHVFSGFHNARLLHSPTTKQPRLDGTPITSDDRDVGVTHDANDDVNVVAPSVARSAGHDSTVNRSSNWGLLLPTSQRQNNGVVKNRAAMTLVLMTETASIKTMDNVLAFELTTFGSKFAAPFAFL